MYERPKHGYCECCEVRYADLDMVSDLHMYEFFCFDM